MSGSVALWAVVILLPVLHFFLHVGLGIGPWAPDLLTVSVLVTAVKVKTETAAGIGFALGLMEDALSILSFGASTMALTAVGILGTRSSNFFVGESVGFLVSYLTLGIWLRGAIHWVLVWEGSGYGLVRILLVQTPAAALYGAAVGTILLLITGAWRREVG